ncbi:MAG: MOSC domain-containing protein [Cyanobacteria bacterium P01_A01_bin.40]
MLGKIVGIFLTPLPMKPMISVQEAKLESGQGIVGDRYHSRLGTFSQKLAGLPDQEITLVEVEEIERLNKSTRLNLDLGDLRRNLVTEGVCLNELVDKCFFIGDTTLQGIRLCEPCKHLESLIGEEIIPNLMHRGGLRAKIVSGGVIRVDDKVNEYQ